MKKYYPSDELEEFLGSGSKVTRAQVVKEVWAYASEEDLKTTKKVKGRNMAAVKADSVLAPIIGKGVRGLGDIAKGISDHLLDD
jgi:chromatin remodeling complex protein RSC6